MGRKKKSKKRSSVQSEPAVSPVAPSSRFRFFLWMSGFFALAALFIRLDAITVWPGAEARLLTQALSDTRGSYLPAYLSSLLTQPGADLFAGADLFFLFPRLLSAVLLVVAALIFYRWGRKLFGPQVVQLQLLLLAASLYLPFHGKVATPDAALLLAHLGLWLSAILVVRSGRLSYQLYLGVFALLGGILAPFNTLVLSLVVLGFFLFRAPLATVARRGWIAPVAALVGLLAFPPPGMLYFGWKSSAYGYAILGTLPFIGFLIGGLRDLVYKLGRREELALLLAGAFVGGLVAGSPLFAVSLSLLAGKQLQLYFGPRYPWNNWVRGPSILHLIFALIGSFLLLLGGFITFRGDGYRAFMGMVAAYWIFSLFGVLGIYGMRRDFTIGGVVLSGILATLFFWVQVYPYFETQRNWPITFISELKQRIDWRSSKIYVPVAPNEDAASNLPPYLHRAKIEQSTTPRGTTHRVQVFPADTMARNLIIDVEGRSGLRLYRFGLEEN